MSALADCLKKNDVENSDLHQFVKLNYAEVFVMFLLKQH